VLYLPALPQTFATACRGLRTWRGRHQPDQGRWGAWNDRFLHDQDELQVPYLTMDSTADFAPQLASTRFIKDQAQSRRISKAEQKLRFVLHERGAKVDATVEGNGPFGGAPEITPRRFIHDRPFFVFLWRDKADWPYFGAWIGDTESMQAWE
jgi:hypothetical protein